MTPKFQVLYYHDFIAWMNMHIAYFDTMEEAEACAENLASNEYYCGIELSIVIKRL